MSRRNGKGNRLSVLWLSLIGMMTLCWTLPAQRPSMEPPQFPIPPKKQEQNPKTGSLTMRVEGGRVTAKIIECPLQTALEELAERTGIIFELRSQENPQVSVHLHQVSLHEAIERIASGSNTMFFYSQDEPEAEKVTLVRVFPRGNEPAQPSIVYLGTGAVTKSNDAIETPEQALKALAESTKVEEREKAIEILVAGKNDAAIKALTNAMSDAAPEIRVAAIEGLVAMDASDALPGILRRLKDGNPGVRQSAATAVALLGSAENIKHLKPLSSDKDASVAAAAEMAMRKLSTSAKR